MPTKHERFSSPPSRLAKTNHFLAILPLGLFLAKAMCSAEESGSSLSIRYPSSVSSATNASSGLVNSAKHSGPRSGSLLGTSRADWNPSKGRKMWQISRTVASFGTPLTCNVGDALSGSRGGGGPPRGGPIGPPRIGGGGPGIGGSGAIGPGPPGPGPIIPDPGGPPGPPRGPGPYPPPGPCPMGGGGPPIGMGGGGPPRIGPPP
mmetsp:Transcript_12697/g.54515  ORF Transcript_12697/g.54515 Transcript_12697/m.54515 type:complete len:205 (-) Transcript_12697:613-1227(-)